MGLVRLVVTGAPGAGKSTLIRTISEIEVLNTDRTATDATAQLKPKTTVAFDFGRLAFGANLELHVYGTPGQERFNFMWDILMQRAQAYLLLVAAHRPHDFNRARQIISQIDQQFSMPMIIGLTHTDVPGAWRAEQILPYLGFMRDRSAPTVIAVNPQQRISALESISMLLVAFFASQNANASIVNPAKNLRRQAPYAQPIQPVRSSSRISYSLKQKRMSQTSSSSFYPRAL
ncbi:MAG: GTP-binding protein [Elainellaceae cyanobacterium]